MTRSRKKKRGPSVVRKPDAHDVHDYMNVVGNTGYLWQFIDYFEKKLDEEIVPYREQYTGVMSKIYDRYAYEKCPNFAVWIRLYVELICNKALAELCRAQALQTKINKYHYKPTIEEIIKIIEAEYQQSVKPISEFNDMVRAIKLTVELRHSLQHGGIPSIIREMQFSEINIEDVAKMVVPQNYKETKGTFSKANKLIELLPRPILVCYGDGHVEIKKQGPRRAKDVH